MFDSFLDAINARGPDRPGLVRDVRGCAQSGNLDAQPTHLAKPTNSAAATTRTQVRTSVFSGIFQTPQNSASVRSALTRGQSLPASVERSEEHTSELQSLMRTSYAVFCLKQK